MLAAGWLFGVRGLNTGKQQLKNLTPDPNIYFVTENYHFPTIQISI